MNKRISRFQYFIYCIFIILPIYQDSPFVEFIGSSGVSMMPVVSMVGIIVVIVLYKRILVNRYIRTWIKLGVFLIVISYIVLFIWWILGNPMNLYKEWLPTKGIKIILQYFAFISYTIVVYMFVRRMNTVRIFMPIYLTLLFLTVICLIELTEIPNALRFIHYSGGFPYWRIRLLTKESSWTAVMILNYSLLSLFYGIEYKRKFITCSSVVCSAILLFSSESKTLLGIVFIGIAIYMIYVMKKISIRSMLLMIIIFVFFMIYISIVWGRLKNLILTDIENFTSVTTRSYTIIVAIIMGFIYPLGVGASTFVGLFPRYLERWLPYIPSWLNSSEITLRIYGTDDTGLSACSGLFQYHAFWGIFGTVIFLTSFFRINKEIRNSVVKNKNILTMTLLSNIVMLAFTTGVTYEFWMLIAVLMGITETKQVDIDSLK